MEDPKARIVSVRLSSEDVRRLDILARRLAEGHGEIIRRGIAELYKLL